MKKRSLLLLASLSLVLALSGCGGKDAETTTGEEALIEETTGNEEADASDEDLVEDVIPAGTYRSELTNEPIDESLKDQRPIAAMIDNELTALPHYGMTKADVVYEMMNSTKNGRITRFMALVKDWGSIEQLGSIRSVRPTNILLAAEWNAVICHDGGPFYINPYLEDPSAAHFSGTFSRVNNGKPREFTEYILSGDLEKNFKNSNYSTTYNEYYEGPHYQFATESNQVDLSDDSTVKNASKVTLPFEHNGSYLTYDESDQLYYYFEYNQAHKDPGNNNQQLSFKNLLIQCCSFAQYDENGYMIFNCIGQGMKGYYVTNGKAIKVTWEKLGTTEPTRYYDSDGNEITINTGKTYVAFVPDDNWHDLAFE